MAERHLTDIDEQVLARLRKRAQQEGTSLEERIRSLLEWEPEKETEKSDELCQTLQMPPYDRSLRDVDPIEAPGISASELLVRHRRR